MSKPPTWPPTDTGISQALSFIAPAVDQLLQRVFGCQLLFSLQIWRSSDLQRAFHYTANCDRADVVASMREVIAKWDAEHPDTPAHEIH